MCQTTLYLQFSECEDSHLFDITLDPLTKYYYSIVDKFGNKYNGEVVTDLSGYFSLNNSDFLPYLFNKNAGNFTLTLKENSASCDYLNIVKCGNIYGNIVFSFISKNEVLVPNFISSYTAGTSTIDFTNNGGDDWDISFLATPTTLQSSANIVQYIYNVEYWVGGVQTNIESGSKTTDYTLNTSGNGACIYIVNQTYILDNGTFFRIDMLIKVDAIGNVIAYIKNFGSTVNSVNGLYIDITANNYQFGVSYPIDWYAYDNFPPSTLTPIGIGDTINGSLPLTTVGVGYTFVLGSIFTDDFTTGIGSSISTNIS
jgi:hypothetical protein